MPELILETAQLVESAAGVVYEPAVHGQARSDGTWEGWIEFRPAIGGGAVLHTGRETTQSNRASLVYWASGLEPVYFEGALARARLRQETPVEPEKLSEIEAYVLDFFRTQGTTKLLTQLVFDASIAYANADLVRAFEALEKRWRFLVRYTAAGNDWLHLTPEGARYAGLPEPAGEQTKIHPHPPKIIT